MRVCGEEGGVNVRHQGKLKRPTLICLTLPHIQLRTSTLHCKQSMKMGHTFCCSVIYHFQCYTIFSLLKISTRIRTNLKQLKYKATIGRHISFQIKTNQFSLLKIVAGKVRKSQEHCLDSFKKPRSESMYVNKTKVQIQE